MFHTSQCTWSPVVLFLETSGSRKCSTKLCVPAGTFVHVRGGETGFGTACVYLFGMMPPSIQPVVVSVMGAAAPPPPPPRAGAWAAITIANARVRTLTHR